MTTNIITNNLPWVPNYITWQLIVALCALLGFGCLIAFLDDFISRLRDHKPFGISLISVLCCVAVIAFCVFSMFQSTPKYNQQLKALKTTTFKVASVSREIDNDEDKFIYHVESNDFGVKTITAPVEYNRGSADAVASESSVKTMTIKYGKLDQTSDGQKNLYQVVKKTYR